MNDIEKENQFWTKIIPWYFVMFFMVIFIVNGIFVYIANKSFSGLETTDAFQKGLEYNDTIARINKQKQLGWKDNFNYTKKTSSELSSLLSFSMVDKNDNQIAFRKVTALIFRPTNIGDDFEIEFQNDGKNNFTKNVSFPKQGVWEVRLQAEIDDMIYKNKYRIFVEDIRN